MRFKIQGEKEEVNEGTFTTVVEVLGKKAIEKLIEDKLFAELSELEKQIVGLRARIEKLEEEISIKRREPLKLE